MSLLGRASQKGANVEEKTESNFVEYVKDGSGWKPTGHIEIIKKLPAGLYKAIPDRNHMDATATPMSFSMDGLIHLPDTEGDKVISEIKHFWTLEKRYAEFGFSHKRGFLLHGPPGSGKTTTINQVMKNQIENDGLVVFFADPYWTQQLVSRIKEIEPDRHVLIILEDLDEIINQNSEAEVLAILDGQSSTKNTVYIATTNYPEDLDGRVANRPSRFDRVVRIDVPSDAARKLFFESKIPAQYSSQDIISKFVAESKGMSIAHCKEMIAAHFCLGQSIEDVCARLKGMKKLPTSKANTAKMGLGGDE